MTKILTIDIGNTNVTLGLYVGNQLGPRWRLATDNERMPDEYGLQFLGLLDHAGRKITELEGICLSSVVPPLTSRVVQACSQYLGLDPLIIGPEIKTGIKILYEEPGAVGADRIADVVAVNELYGGPACVVDFGTATTFNAITAKGEYLGGAIAPGIRIAVDALTQRTAKLPRIDLVVPPSVIGKNTVHAMQSGILLGYVSLVEGMVNRFRMELGNDMKVIATGGMAELIAPYSPTIQVVAPWLTLDGLRIIWEMNNQA
ncbi:MAG: type III pantothenate kinase [Anaerolineae bacterium]|jgi:type III pantothenate kinase|nr:type III pantothenate kinase [Anaerolineae bacterium]